MRLKKYVIEKMMIVELHAEIGLQISIKSRWLLSVWENSCIFVGGNGEVTARWLGCGNVKP